jgi:hypothetical protein
MTMEGVVGTSEERDWRRVGELLYVWLAGVVKPM